MHKAFGETTTRGKNCRNHLKCTCIAYTMSSTEITIIHENVGPTIFNFSTRPHNLTTSQSRRVEFQCSVRSTLIPTFMWNFTRKGALKAETIANRSGPLSADYSISTPAGQRSQVLIITSVQWRHVGVYTCIVSSENSQIQAEANLNIPSEHACSNIFITIF